MNFQSVIDQHFADPLEESTFVTRTLEVLTARGFSADNTIACVAVCRDELCSPLQREVRKTWGEAFNMSSLAGVPFCGATAFGAAHAHAPTAEDKERYVYFLMAHIGIGAGGELGQCVRVGRTGTSKACGALVALQQEMHGGKVAFQHDPDDIEQSELRRRLLPRLGWGATPDLIELVQAARLEALETLERLIARTVDTTLSDYAVFNGVQIHGSGQRALVWPAVSYLVIDGVRREVALREVA